MKKKYLLFIFIIPFSICIYQFKKIKLNDESEGELYTPGNNYSYFYAYINDLSIYKNINFYFHDKNYFLSEENMYSCITFKAPTPGSDPFAHCLDVGKLKKYHEISTLDEKYHFYVVYFDQLENLGKLNEYSVYLIIRYFGINPEGKLDARIADTNLCQIVKKSIGYSTLAEKIFYIVVGSINLLFIIIITIVFICIYCKRKIILKMIRLEKSQQTPIDSNNSSNIEDSERLVSNENNI